MVVELGLFALVLALLLSVAQAFFGLAGPHFGNRRWMAAARPAVAGQFVFVALSFAVLAWAFYKNDFSVLYVANNSNSALPTLYRFSAVWGAHEGSLLLWALALSSWSVAVAHLQQEPAAVVRRACDRRAGLRQHRLPGLHPVHLESVRAADPGGCRTART